MSAPILARAASGEWQIVRWFRWLLGVAALGMLGFGLWRFFASASSALEVAATLLLAGLFGFTVIATYFWHPWLSASWPDDPTKPATAHYARALWLAALTSLGLVWLEPAFYHLAFWVGGLGIAAQRGVRWAWLGVGLAVAVMAYGRLGWPLQWLALSGFVLEAVQYLILTALLFVFLREALRREGSAALPPDPVLPASPPEGLTAREQQILRLVASGQSNKQIANALGLSEGTVKNYVSALLSKLGVRNRTQAANRARELGIEGAKVRQ